MTAAGPTITRVRAVVGARRARGAACSPATGRASSAASPRLRVTVTSHANMSEKTMTSNAARLMNPKPKTVPDVVSERPMRRVARATR